jgi:hypothetical protein
MENLNKVETAVALSAVKAVITAHAEVGGVLAGESELTKEHPLNTAATKLEANLKEFNDGEQV